jgi:hypothetical protein
MLVNNIRAGQIVCMYGRKSWGKTTCAKQLCKLNRFDKTVVFTVQPDRWTGRQDCEVHDLCHMTPVQASHILQAMIDTQTSIPVGRPDVMVIFDQGSQKLVHTKPVLWLAYNSRICNVAMMFINQIPSALPSNIAVQADIMMTGRYQDSDTCRELYNRFSNFESLSDFKAALPSGREFLVTGTAGSAGSAGLTNIEYFDARSKLHARL